jgi:outer membrane protein TolC
MSTRALALCLTCFATATSPLAGALELLELNDILEGPTPTSRQQAPYSGTSSRSKTLPFAGKAALSKDTRVAKQEFSTRLMKPEELAYEKAVYILDFKSAIQLALRQSLTLESMKSKTKTAEYEKLSAISQLLPDISVGYRQSRFQGGIQVFDGNPELAYITTILPELKATLPINLAGQQFFDISSRDRLLLAAEYVEKLVTDQHLYYVSSDYLNLLNQHLAIQAAQQNLEESQAQLKFAKARFEEGLGVLLEVLEAQNEVDAQTKNMLRIKQEIIAANQRLNAHFGFSHTTTIIPVMESVTPLSVFDESTTDLDSLLQTALTTSPKAKQAFHRYEAAQLQMKSAIASLFPTLTASTYANLIGNEFDNLLTSRFAGVEINLNVLEGMGVTSYARIKQMQENTKRVMLDYEQTKRDIERDITTMYYGLENTKAQLPIAKNQLLTAEQGKDQAWGRYQNGVGSYLELLQSSSRLQGARTGYVGQQLEYRRKQLEIAYQVGALRNILLKQGLPQIVNLPTYGESSAATDQYAVTTRPIQAMNTASPSVSATPSQSSLSNQSRMLPGREKKQSSSMSYTSDTLPQPAMQGEYAPYAGSAYANPVEHPLAPPYLPSSSTMSRDAVPERVPKGYAVRVDGRTY